MEPDKERLYAEAIPVDLEEAAAPPPPDEEALPALPEKPPSRPVFRMGFLQKITLHLSILILLSGLVLTAAMAFQFRRIMYRQELRSAFTVYTATANRLAAHYRSHKGKFIPEILSSSFGERFMRLEGAPSVEQDQITHRPSHLVIYNLTGQVVFEYSENPPAEPARDRPPEELPRRYQQHLDAENQIIQISGSIAPEDEVVAYLVVDFPSTIGAKLTDIYRRMALVTLGIVLLSIGLSLVFARRQLAPINRLIHAARKVHGGDLSHQVPVRMDDEIGDLTRTFNEMVGSLARRITALHQLQESLLRIGGTLDSQRLYPTLTSLFTSMSGARSCRLYLYNEAQDRLEPRPSAREEHLPRPDEDELTQLTFEDRWAHFVDADNKITPTSNRVREMAIPLLSGKHRMGVIRIGRRKQDGLYDEETLTILHTLAQYASMAIDNANLYGKLAERERIEQEMKWARSIQQSMLPREHPHVPGFEIQGASFPATEVGGDYFDFISGLDSAWHIVIGDVSGKGVPAALIMSTVRSLMHTYLQFKSSPRELLTLVNRSLSENLEPDMFVTLSSLRLDPNRRRAAMARAGHEPVLVLRASGKIESIAPRGAALGLLAVDRFQETIEELEFDLYDHDTLVLYTDGITEAQNTQRVDFGQERLEELLLRHAHLSLPALHEKILSEVSRYSHGMPQHDDITLVIVRRNGA